jgi:regulator of protease activity HflC (stomatin/prohibitin superfamily)
MEATIFGIVFALLTGTYIYRSFQIIEEGQSALVERFGKYQKTMEPGINIVLPFLDRVTLIKSSREQVLEISPQPCTTSDSVSVSVSGVMYWQISDLKDARYNIENVDKSLVVSLATQIQTQIGRCDLDNIIGGQERINSEILEGISNDTKDWGIKILRVRLGEITIPTSVLQSMEKQKAAEIEKKAKSTKSTDLETLLLNGPTATKNQLNTIVKNRKAINQWRTK